MIKHKTDKNFFVKTWSSQVYQRTHLREFVLHIENISWCAESDQMIGSSFVSDLIRCCGRDGPRHGAQNICEETNVIVIRENFNVIVWSDLHLRTVTTQVTGKIRFTARWWWWCSNCCGNNQTWQDYQFSASSSYLASGFALPRTEVSLNFSQKAFLYWTKTRQKGILFNSFILRHSAKNHLLGRLQKLPKTKNFGFPKLGGSEIPTGFCKKKCIL